MMFRTVLLAALAAPLAFGEYSYTYDYTDAPTAAPTSLTAPPTTTGAPTRTETYAPTRLTETPSYAPTTDTYAPTAAPTATPVPSSVPSSALTPPPQPSCQLCDSIPGNCNQCNAPGEPGWNWYRTTLCDPDHGPHAYMNCTNCIGIEANSYPKVPNAASNCFVQKTKRSLYSIKN